MLGKLGFLIFVLVLSGCVGTRMQTNAVNVGTTEYESDFSLKCPECVELGLRSTVTVGVGMTTLMNTHQFYDEDGKYHFHDPNHSSTSYTCSQGHEWSTSHVSKCWCQREAE